MPTAFGQQAQHHAFDIVVMPVEPRFWGQRSSDQVFGGLPALRENYCKQVSRISKNARLFHCHAPRGTIRHRARLGTQRRVTSVGTNL
jgi:hypothetical protein